MPPVCSCGASLPEDARFCHRCGKPQREESVDAGFDPVPVVRLDVHASPPPAAPPSVPHLVTFSNPLALRTSLLIASLTTVLEIVPFLNVIVPVIGGFASAALYQRRSGQILTTGAGAKLGWITAILNALLVTVFVSLNFAIAGPANLDLFRESVRQQASSPAQQQALQMLNDTRYVALMVLVVWILLFVFSSVLYMAGGALAARLYRAKAS